MSTACRHCFPDASSTWGGDAAYASVILFGKRSGDGLLSEMERLETKVIPGVTVWCEACQRISVLSYTLYLHTSSAPKSTAMCMDYYNSMCLMGNRLSESFV